MGVENESGLIALQSWLKQQQHLPQNIEPLLLRRYIQAVSGDVEKAKKLFELSITMRNNSPHIFLNRDPRDKSSQRMLEVTDMLPLPYPTKENYKVLLYRLIDFDADNFNFIESLKMFFMVADVRLVTADENGLTNGDIPIFDMAGFSLRHITKVVLSALRIYMKYTQEAHPVQLKHIHVINCSSFLDRTLCLVKPFIKSEVFKLIHFHLPDSNTLYQFVSKDLLPNEYGGKAGYTKDLKSDFIKKLEQHRDYLMDDSRWRLQKTKNNFSKKQHEEINGNFRTLSID